MVEVLIGLGSNIDAQQRLLQASRLLRAAFPDIHFSACYSNAAVGFTGADFINAAAVFHTALDIPALLTALHEVEAQCGRLRDDPKWAPRAMDLDVLLLDDCVGEWPGLKLPRADLLRRAYMLQPAAELQPARVHPTAGHSLRQLWQEFALDAPPLTRIELDLNGSSG